MLTVHVSLHRVASVCHVPSSPLKNLEKLSLLKLGSSTTKTELPVLDLARAAAAKPRKERNLHGETMVENVNANCLRSRTR